MSSVWPGSPGWGLQLLALPFFSWKNLFHILTSLLKSSLPPTSLDCVLASLIGWETAGEAVHPYPSLPWEAVLHPLVPQGFSVASLLLPGP